MNSSHAQNWEDLAKLDPLWAVLSYPEKKYGNWNIEEFFQTGEEEIAHFINTAQNVKPSFSTQRVLDFGCGVGRLSRAFTKYFDTVIGIDISAGMIEKAREFHSEYHSVSFIVNSTNDLSLFEDNHFDCIYTNIVLQHIPEKKVIKKFIQEFLRVLKPGGMLAFQLPSYVPVMHRFQVPRRLYTLLRLCGVSEKTLYTKFKLYPIQMNFISEKKVVSWVEKNNGKILLIQNDTSASPKNKSNIYFVSK